MAMSDYLEAALLNEVLRNTGYTPPATVYLAMYTAAPSDSGGGTEVVGGSYARQAVTFAAPVGNTVSNSASLTFTNMPACTVVAIGIFDALTSGNLLFHHTLGTSKTYAAAESVTVSIGDITVSLD